MKVHDVFDDGKSVVYFVMDRFHHDLLDGNLVQVELWSVFSCGWRLSQGLENYVMRRGACGRVQ